MVPAILAAGEAERGWPAILGFVWSFFVVIVGSIAVGSLRQIVDLLLDRFLPILSEQPPERPRREGPVAFGRAVGWAVILVMAPIALYPGELPDTDQDGSIVQILSGVMVLAGAVSCMASALARLGLPRFWRRDGVPKDALWLRALAVMVVWTCGGIVALLVARRVALGPTLLVAGVLALACCLVTMLPARLGDRRRAADLARREPPALGRPADLNPGRWTAVQRTLGWVAVLLTAGMAVRHRTGSIYDSPLGWSMLVATLGALLCLLAAWFRWGIAGAARRARKAWEPIGLRALAEVAAWGGLAAVLAAGWFVHDRGAFVAIVLAATIVAGVTIPVPTVAARRAHERAARDEAADPAILLAPRH